MENIHPTQGCTIALVNQRPEMVFRTNSPMASRFGGYLKVVMICLGIGVFSIKYYPSHEYKVKPPTIPCFRMPDNATLKFCDPCLLNFNITAATAIFQKHQALSSQGALEKAISTCQLLTPEPPLPDMYFIAQKPGKDYSDFPEEIRLRGHSFLRTRTYPPLPRDETCNGCFPFIYHTVLNVESCQDTPTLQMLILVTTVPREGEIRSAIRQTWGRNTKKIRTVFVFGVGWSRTEQEILLEESERYGDVLQESYVDSYFNLSLKVLSGYHWWSKSCQQAPFVLRTAGDNFINIPHMMEYLNSKDSWPDVIIGDCIHNALVKTDPNDKWWLSIVESPNPFFPTYCVGTAFITPASTVKLILKHSPDVPFFVIEDVYFGMVMTYAKANSSHPDDYGLSLPNFQETYRKGFVNGHDNCNINPNWMSIHNVRSQTEMYWISNYCKSKSNVKTLH